LLVAALNAPDWDPSTRTSRAASCAGPARAVGEVTQRLGLGNAYVIFGHTHRAGPIPGDREQEWLAPGGAQLVNTGCWTYDGYFLTSAPGESPYWPGGCVLVEADGPPQLRRLLEDRPHAQLRPSRA
jgi:hypothetical protein